MKLLLSYVAGALLVALSYVVFAYNHICMIDHMVYVRVHIAFVVPMVLLCASWIIFPSRLATAVLGCLAFGLPFFFTVIRPNVAFVITEGVLVLLLVGVTSLIQRSRKRWPTSDPADGKKRVVVDFHLRYPVYPPRGGRRGTSSSCGCE